MHLFKIKQIQTELRAITSPILNILNTYFDILNKNSTENFCVALYIVTFFKINFANYICIIQLQIYLYGKIRE